MAKTITTRLPDEFVIDLGKIAHVENVDTSTVVRKLLAKAIEEWRKDYAVEMYKKGDFSFGQAAKFSGVGVWDFPELIKQKKLFINYDEEELDADLKSIKWKKR